MFKKIGIILFFAVVVGARHTVPLQGLPLLSDTAFAGSYTQNGQPCPPECVSDSMEIETYYPSPYGYYEELRGDKIIVGDTDNSRINETDLPPSGTITFEPLPYAPLSTSGNLYEGSLYYDDFLNKFRFYDGSDWQDVGGGGAYWDKSSANANNIYYTQSGNVGIGTASPMMKLDVNGAISGFGIVPIGSIIAWHKSFSNTPALPDGWVECNGQVLNDPGSVYNGQTIPNLNGDARFLRGSSASGVLQADMFKAHYHKTYRNNYDYNAGSQVGSYISGGITGSVNDQNMASEGGIETRPINMSVVWVMRVK